MLWGHTSSPYMLDNLCHMQHNHIKMRLIYVDIYKVIMLTGIISHMSHADIIMLHFKILMLDEWMQGGIITDCMTDNNIIAPT